MDVIQRVYRNAKKKHFLIGLVIGILLFPFTSLVYFLWFEVSGRFDKIRGAVGAEVVYIDDGGRERHCSLRSARYTLNEGIFVAVSMELRCPPLAKTQIPNLDSGTSESLVVYRKFWPWELWRVKPVAADTHPEE